MALYGSPEGIKALLRTNDSAEFSDDEESRIADLQPVVSLAIEQYTGAVFYPVVDAAPTAPVATRDQEGDGGARLYLDMGLRSVTSIVERPSWGAGAWTGGTPVTSSQFRLTRQVANGAYRVIERMDGVWSGTVLVTGVWEDAYTAVPDDIHYIANFVAAELYKAQQASPHGLLGPEGAMVPIRNALAAPEVRMKLDFYRVGPGMWVL